EDTNFALAMANRFPFLSVPWALEILAIARLTTSVLHSFRWLSYAQVNWILLGQEDFPEGALNYLI
ncbi:MAG: hypothetical protein WCC37_23770, partial [Candidatus Sulfotelmatobacter sp.]